MTHRDLTNTQIHNTGLLYRGVRDRYWYFRLFNFVGMRTQHARTHKPHTQPISFWRFSLPSRRRFHSRPSSLCSLQASTYWASACWCPSRCNEPMWYAYSCSLFAVCCACCARSCFTACFMHRSTSLAAGFRRWLLCSRSAICKAVQTQPAKTLTFSSRSCGFL